ncbi:glutamate-tRNA ligase [Planoprotostelium fungivorum]|uniref:glutamate--tRNA ligase n=1 Tax=Planoprotostelium fungivorum TaxID=1890364 RepID=A0A2P6MYL2_9EUKA|nr:glutamate-tRNA ligase [Planoprotostelium fungivorum]
MLTTGAFLTACNHVLAQRFRCCQQLRPPVFSAPSSRSIADARERGSFETVRTRYAPSPTGSLHLGGLRTALYNYLFAKKHRGQFLLRIEDTDKNREVKGAVEAIIGDLRWGGIYHDEGPNKESDVGPFVQSERLPIYQHHAGLLLKKGHAYRCFCTVERLAETRSRASEKTGASLYDRHCLSLTPEEIEEKLKKNESHTLRMKVPDGITIFEDVVAGHVSIRNSQIDDQIIIKSDGYPTYHFANVVDDHLMRISHVIRGTEWLISTPKHIMLYDMFGWEKPIFAHLPLLTNLDKSKLSKRQGDASVGYYKDQGYMWKAVINYVAFLGWTPSSHNTTTTLNTPPSAQSKNSQDINYSEVMSMDQLVEQFSLSKVHRAPAVVSLDKLNWLNENHLRKAIREDPSEILPELRDNMERTFGSEVAKRYDDQYLKEKRISMLREVTEKHEYFFVEPQLSITADWVNDNWKEGTGEMLEDFATALEGLPPSGLQSSHISTTAESVAKRHNKKVSAVYQPARYFVSGTSSGGATPHTILALGPLATNFRLKSRFDFVRELEFSHILKRRLYCSPANYSSYDYWRTSCTTLTKNNNQAELITLAVIAGVSFTTSVVCWNSGMLLYFTKPEKQLHSSQRLEIIGLFILSFQVVIVWVIWGVNLGSILSQECWSSCTTLRAHVCEGTASVVGGVVTILLRGWIYRNLTQLMDFEATLPHRVELTPSPNNSLSPLLPEGEEPTE